MTLTETAASAEFVALPPGFILGAATAAYQIEGAVAADGRTPSIWDTFSHTPGKIVGDDNGDVACDHYHRMPADVALMAQLGLHAYRFSASWSRVVPHGASTVNPAGLDFYSRLVDELLAHGIAPYLTLYHWDLPQELQDAGGWASRDTAYRFAEFASLLGEQLGDRVATWITLNEPRCSSYLGYLSGVHAPGHTIAGEAFAAVHHLLLGHGLAASALRVNTGHTPVGITLDLASLRAATEQPEDLDAMRNVDALTNRVFLDPLHHGRYPADLIADTAAMTDWSFVLDGDLSVIAAPIDVMGVNYYQPTVVRAAAAGDERFPGSDRAVAVPAHGPTTSMDWTIDATGLRDILLRVRRDWPGLPVIVTENGAAFDDAAVDGAVHDVQRTAYLREHLAAVASAIVAGADVRGYLVWSLMDNFEWAWGFDKRFGLIHIDYETLQRTVKDSGLWYRDQIASLRGQDA